MRRTLELIFRHGVIIAALLIIPIVTALAFVWAQPRQYEGTATLWALQRYSVIGATGPEADLNSTPASTQVTALTELLQAHSFDLAVAKQTDLASTFDAATRADPRKLNDAIEHELSTKVIPTAVGYNLFQITYDNKSPKIAQQVVAAVVGEFEAQATSFSIAEAKQLIQAYQGQLLQAKQAASEATRVAANYAASHPGAQAFTDPAYSQLLQQAQAAQTNADALQANINQLQSQLATVGNGTGGLYSIVDAPNVDSKPVSRAKGFLLGGGIGLAVGLLVTTLLLVALMRRDRSIYSSEDLRRLIQLPITLELTELPSDVAAAVAAPAQPALLERIQARR
ncbi:MAG TPA: hypothetical protein VFQ25_04175 [Ktedonobacterales bacterium]|nr:hypothetical protein [Ktedonobacterales bacterium]